MRLFWHRVRPILRNAIPDGLRRRLRDIQRKKAALRLNRTKKDAIARYGSFSPDELYRELSGLGLKPGGVLLVQSSFGDFYNFTGTADQMLQVLERIVGPEGTLMMPAHPKYPENGPFVFDSRRSPPKTGLICELFRRRPGVIRSLHPTHSMCAKGPLASALLSEHHLDPLSCGPLSPYAKLARYDADILGLGLPPGYTTFLHVVEDLNITTYPKKLYADRVYEFKVIGPDGASFQMALKRRDTGTGARLNLSNLIPHLSQGAHRAFRIHGIPCFQAKAAPLLDELQGLTKRGILLYD